MGFQRLGHEKQQGFLLPAHPPHPESLRPQGEGLSSGSPGWGLSPRTAQLLSGKESEHATPPQSLLKLQIHEQNTCCVLFESTQHWGGLFCSKKLKQTSKEKSIVILKMFGKEFFPTTDGSM